MSKAKLKATGFEPEYLRQCIDVLSDNPPALRWRARPREHFMSDLAFRQWKKVFAGQVIRPSADGRLRVSLTVDGARRLLDAKAIIAEIGVTPLGAVQSRPPNAPDDRLADTRALAGGGRLAVVIHDAMAATGRSLGDLTVMGSDADPYRIDTPAQRRNAQWFAGQVARFVPDPNRRIHVRGVFYACVSAGDVVKPDGDPFDNTVENADFLGEAAKCARWLGYLDFERLVDNKNDAPIVRPAPSSEDPSAHAWANEFELGELDPDNLGVSAGLAYFEARQPYRLAFFGEKTSLEDVLAPLAVEYSADLYLTGGQISDTLVYGMAKDAVADGRPLVVLTFSDFDPAGYWDMPTCIGRKLQALRDLLFPDLVFTVAHAALGPGQVQDLGLPDSPLKSGEKRAAKWLELYGSEQTEIDALATLKPDDLERIAREAVAPWFESDLGVRVQAAGAAWLAAAQAGIDAQVDVERLDDLQARAAAALDELREVNADLATISAEVEVGEPPPLPSADLAALAAAQAESRDSVLIDSDMDYVEAVDSLHAHSEMAARRSRL